MVLIRWDEEYDREYTLYFCRWGGIDGIRVKFLGYGRGWVGDWSFRSIVIVDFNFFFYSLYTCLRVRV